MPVFWIIAGLIVLTACCAGKKGTPPKHTASTNQNNHKNPIRIDHTHYCDDDDYECSVCGIRFQKKAMVCPHCGARFTGTKVDDTEYDEELDEELEWDEEEEGS